jgi:hypothetical protein
MFLFSQSKTNLTTDSFAHMLDIIETSDDTIIIYAEKRGTTQAVGKSTYAL